MCFQSLYTSIIYAGTVVGVKFTPHAEIGVYTNELSANGRRFSDIDHITKQSNCQIHKLVVCTI